MKLKSTFLLLVLLTVLSGITFGQLSISATYTDGDIAVDAGFQIPSQSSTCPGLLTVTIPLGAEVTGVDVIYDFEAIPGSGAYKSYQLSELRCVSEGGVNEGVLASFPNDWTTGVLTYERTGLEIANGVMGGGDIMFELHAGTTQYGQTGCSTEKMKINDGTWTVTVYFLDPSYPSPPSNPNPEDGAEDVSIDVGTITWDFGDNTEEYDLYFGTSNPPSTKVVDAQPSGATGSYTLETLSGATKYYWQVVSRNSAKNEIEGPVWSFGTECLPAGIPLFVDFDDLEVPQWSPPHFINPLCWTLLYECTEAYANQGVYLSTNAFSEPNCWMAANEGDGNAWNMMIMPEMADDLNTLQLSFMAKCNYSHPLSIGTMSDPNDAETYTEFTTINPSTNDYAEYEIPFSAYTGTDKHLAVRYAAISPNTWEYTYIDNVVISNVPTCPKPKDLSPVEVSAESAAVTWLEQGSATQWNLEYVLAGENPTGTPDMVVTENPVTIMGLDPATEYDFYVQADCGGGDISLWSSPGSFTTACTQLEVPLFENFDASTDLPDCWSTAGTQYGSWSMQTYSSYSAPNNIRIQGDVSEIMVLISPPLEVPGGSMADIQLNFFAKKGYNDYDFEVGTISNPLDYTTFNPVATLSPTGNNTWEEYEVWFNNYQGDDTHIAFKVGGEDVTAQSLNLDDINIGLLPSCLNPIDLWVNDIMETEARLNFTESGSATMWNIEVGPYGFEPGTGNQTQSYTYELAGDDYSFVLTGLEAGTFYDVYMNADCGGGDISLWSPAASFMSQLPLYSNLPLVEPFDPDFTYTANPPTNGDDWTLNTDLFVSEPNSAWNDYSGISDNVLLVTQRFDLSSKANVYLSFSHIAKTDGNKDHCYVEVSTDGGATFDQIPVEAYFGGGNYYEATQNNPEGPAFDEDSYPDWGTSNQTPENTWWKHETFDLAGYSGSDNVVIRFRLVADQYTDRYGWLIDDVKVDTYTGVETVVDPGMFAVEVDLNATLAETMTISNNGDFPILYTASVQNYSDAMTTLVSEDFEAGLPDDWTVLNEGSSAASMWTWTEPGGYPDMNGTNFMIAQRTYPDTANESLISPAFDGTGYANVFLTWDNVWAKGSSSQPDYAEVFVWDGSEWQSLLYMKTVNVGSWGNPDQTVYDITQYANPEMKVKFYYYGMSYSKTGVDNFMVTASDIPVNWLTLEGETMVTGIVQGGESQNIEVNFATLPSFPLDTWHASIEVTSSDPDNALITVPVSMTVGCFQPWDYSLTGMVHSISIPAAVAPAIFGELLSDTDWIGVFYLDDNGEEACGGAVQWNGTSGVVINAYGDDPTTEEKDGFGAGESFRWSLKKCGDVNQYSALVVYDPSLPNQGSFADFGLSKLTSLQAAYFQYYSFNQGWNSMSAYVMPTDPDVENMFAPMVDQLTIVRNLSSLYWPVEGVNTIGNWDSHSGYVLKTTQDVEYQVAGESMVSGEITLPAGWVYLPVMSSCPVDVMDLFGDHLDDVTIIQELIGTKVFWPAFEIYTLETLEPGKAYSIKLENEITINFPECMTMKSAGTTPAKNDIETSWGKISMTPSTSQCLILSEALAGLEAGDNIGAFDDSNGKIFGYLEVDATDQNLAMTLFGDDVTTIQKDGFVDGEPVSFKLQNAETGEIVDLEVTYSFVLENTTGNYTSGSFSAIEGFKTSASGIGDPGTTGVHIYPNPATDVLNISGINMKSELRIFNVFGEEVLNITIKTSSEINVATLPKGTYVVRISNENGSINSKLVIR
jgi:hypothetical protein